MGVDLSAYIIYSPAKLDVDETDKYVYAIVDGNQMDRCAKATRNGTCGSNYDLINKM